MNKIEITHSGFELTKEIKKYVEKRLSKLDKLAARGRRKGMYAEVKMREDKGHKKNKSTVEVILHLPNERLTAKESTVNLFAAVDIVEAKLANQLRKYKDKSTSHRTDRKGAFKKLRDMADRDFWGSQN